MRTTRDKFLLDPKKTARENLWAAADRATRVLLSRKNLRFTRDEFAELHGRIVLRAVEHFMKHKVGLHKYNRKFPFFDNVFSSVWGVSPGIIQKFVDENRRKISDASMDSESYITGLELATTMEDTGKHPLDDSPVRDREWESKTMERLEFNRRQLKKYHNKGTYRESVAKLEKELNDYEEDLKKEERVSLGLEEL